jgi:hypothetical protein
MNEMNTINEQMGEGMMQSTPKKEKKIKKREKDLKYFLWLLLLLLLFSGIVVADSKPQR